MTYFDYKNNTYPDYIKNGNHAQYILPVAKQVCKGHGVDIGYGKEEWAFPLAFMVDSKNEAPFNDALKLPFSDNYLDFVFSSHCLEHIPDYYAALTEWVRVIKPGGIIFLYLPDVKCEYWRPANNRKHLHILYPEDIKYDLESLNIENVIYSGVDLAYSFAIFGRKNG